ncbi:MAG: TerB N-terminal domain-containing protein [Candidatus Omnitrophica bacterium]|nr:TerB N-terminal domain-containing protein [Candidatus Omnitrophota bacterium]
MGSNNNANGCLIILLLLIVGPSVVTFPVLIIPVILLFVLVKVFSSFSAKNKNSLRSFESNNYRDIQIVQSNKKHRSQSGDECWIKKDQSIEIKGCTIPNGMIYVGEHLHTQQSRTNSYYVQVEPCLINPKLSVSKSNINIEQNLLSYYPTYSDATPQARANYLHWLAMGASDTSAQMGYVFLYFYGLERRFFVDKSIFEWPVIMNEVERLKRIFSSNGSFRHYSNEFLSKARVVSSFHHGQCLYKEATIEYYETWQTPLDVRVALGQMTKEGVPLNARWALAWIYTDESTYFRTPAKRAKKEFEEIFIIKFNQQFPDGLMLKPNKRKITANYRAASSSFEVQLNFGTLPDVCLLEEPKEKIREIVETCTNQLDAYSRLLGRSPDKVNSLEAILLLPSDLQVKSEVSELTEINKLLLQSVKEQGKCLIEGNEILKLWPTKNDFKMTKKEAENISSYLRKHNVGIIPDVVYGDAVLKSSDIAILFNLSDCSFELAISDGYKSASLFLELAMMVALADDHFSESEVLHLTGRLEQAFQLTDLERLRLEHKMQYFVENKNGVEKVRKSIVDKIPKNKRPEIALYLLALAGADGRIDSSEVKVLSGIYKHLGFNDERLYSDLNGFGARWSSEDEPITVKKKGSDPVRYILPEPPKDDKKAVTLDMDMVHNKVKDTEEVAKLLERIFIGDSDIVEEDKVQDVDNADDGLFISLDSPYRALLRELSTREQWKLDEFKKLAESFDLLPGGAIEVINSWAFDNFDEPLIEEDKDLIINVNLYSEVVKNG